MLTQLPPIVVPAIVVVHGIAHGGAAAALAWVASHPGTDTGGWTAARSWLVPGLDPGTATALAAGLWLASLAGFVATGLGIAGVPGLAAAWPWIGVAAAAVSLLGITLFLGTWPPFNTLAAIAVNAGVLWLALGGRP